MDSYQPLFVMRSIVGKKKKKEENKPPTLAPNGFGSLGCSAPLQPQNHQRVCGRAGFLLPVLPAVQCLVKP